MFVTVLRTCTVSSGDGRNTHLHFYRRARTCSAPKPSVSSKERRPRLPSQCPSHYLSRGQNVKWCLRLNVSKMCCINKEELCWDTTPSDDVTTPCSLWRTLTLGSLWTRLVPSVIFVRGLTSSNSMSPSRALPIGLGTPSNVTMNLGLAESPLSLLVCDTNEFRRLQFRSGTYVWLEMNRAENVKMQQCVCTWLGLCEVRQTGLAAELLLKLLPAEADSWWMSAYQMVFPRFLQWPPRLDARQNQICKQKLWCSEVLLTIFVVFLICLRVRDHS